MAKILGGWSLRHWKVLALVLIAVLAVASGGYAYWRFNTQSSSMPYSAAVWPPLELRIELDKTQFQQGETITVRLFLKNIVDSNVTITFSSSGGRIGAIVLDANGTVVFQMPVWTVEATDKITLEPNGQINRILKWDQVGNIPNEYYQKQVPKGTYTIIGQTLQYGIPGYDPPPLSPRRGSEPSLRRLETPPMTITII